MTALSNQLRAVSVHEAAHVVTAIALGGRVFSSTIEPGPIGIGHTVHSRLAPVDMLAVLAAGGVGEQLFGHPPLYGDGDARLADAISTCPAARSAARSRAEQLVRRHDLAMIDIAWTLVQRRTVAGEELHRLFR